jgi:hypothetical protein
MSASDRISESIRRITANYKPGVASGEWVWIRAHHGRDFQRALQEADSHALLHILLRIFQHGASYGIVSPPQASNLTTWQSLVDLPVAELTLPLLPSMPDGAEAIDGVCVWPDSPRHHYLATRVAGLLPPGGRLVEIGGGYGGVYLFLRRMRPDICYVNIDLPETLAIFDFVVSLASGTSISWWPEEGDITLVQAEDRDALVTVGDVACNFRSLSEMGWSDIAAYMHLIDRLSVGSFFHENAVVRLSRPSVRDHREILASDFPLGPGWECTWSQESPWSGGEDRYAEFIYKCRRSS